MTNAVISLSVYVIIMAALAYVGYKRTKSTSDYLLAGKQIHPLIMALSYGATFISTSAIVGFGGAAGQFGMSLLWLTALNIIVGVFIAFVFFGKKTREIGHRLGTNTMPEFFARRFNCQSCRATPAFLFSSLCPYMLRRCLKA
jgi:SSS family solute:Na+ symporter